MPTTSTRELFITNISFNITQQELEAFLLEQSLGLHSVKLVLDRETGRSRGFAFAKIEDPDIIQHAVSILNGKELDRRPLSVREATPRAQLSPRPDNRPNDGYRPPNGEAPRRSFSPDRPSARNNYRDRREPDKGGRRGRQQYHDDDDYRPGRR